MQGESQRPGTGAYPTEWKPRPSVGGRLGAGVAAAFGACAAIALFYLAGRPISVDFFVAAAGGLVALLLALLAALLTWGYYSMRYRLEEDGVTITWLGIREVIPLDALVGFYLGQRLGTHVKVEGLNWPGFHIGSVAVPEFGRVKYYGTSADPMDVLLLATGRTCYAVTPDDPATFRATLVERLEMLPEDPPEDLPEPTTIIPRLLALSILRDPITLGTVAAAVVVAAASFGHVASRFPTLPELMPLHFNQAGVPDLIGPPGDAFRMPILGLCFVGLNLLVAAAIYRERRDASRVLAAATVLIQLVVLVAVLKVVQ